MTPDDLAAHYEASFSATDPEDVVVAALSCRWCLRAPQEVRVRQDAEGGEASCLCGSCGARTTVRLGGEQVLRLGLRPPPRLRLVLG